MESGASSCASTLLQRAAHFEAFPFRPRPARSRRIFFTSTSRSGPLCVHFTGRKYRRLTLLRLPLLSYITRRAHILKHFLRGRMRWTTIIVVGIAVLSTAGSVVARAEPTDGKPYQSAGAVNCSLPGTIIEFGLDGSGAAEVTRIESNFVPMRNAARPGRAWSARLVERDNKQILVLDNSERTRIMVSLPDGKGMAFVTDANGLSDILCQVLVRPSDGRARGVEVNPPTQAQQSDWPPTDKQFPSQPTKSAESDRLLYCVNPEIQYGQYSSYDGGKSVIKILEEKCKREYLDFCRPANNLKIRVVVFWVRRLQLNWRSSDLESK